MDFARDIRGILSDNCFKCHGPDANKRVNDLRLDTPSGLFDALASGKRAVVGGDLAASEIVARLTSSDPDLQMPPPDSGLEVSAQQIQLLSDWVKQGAHWQEHWAFVVPVRPALPIVDDARWAKNPIDRFILAKLQEVGLHPSAEADRRTLIRRVSLDLTGLPPTPQEVEAFLADTSSQAYENLVDRLLASTRYGEQMAVSWLDAARYADTSGYQNDGPRQMWRWRDWVIEAFNSNLPFDQFTIDQLAGDLLPAPTLDQHIATGFNRNHRGNAEGGIIPEEYQVEYVADRVETTMAVWLGLTMGCARCHDHKYDPLSQKEYYQLFAYFNNIPEFGRAIKEGNSPPYLLAPTVAQQAEWAAHNAAVAAKEEAWQALTEDFNTQCAQWQSLAAQANGIADWNVSANLRHHFDFANNLSDSASQATTAVMTAPGAVTHNEGLKAQYSQGPLNTAVLLDGSTVINAGDIANFGYFDKFSISLWFNSQADTGTLVSRMVPVEEGAGYAVQLVNGHLQINLVKRWLDDSIRVESTAKLPVNTWQHLTVVYDGTRLASGIHAYINGQPLELQVRLDGINQTFAALLEPLRIGGGSTAFVGSMDDLRIYNRALSTQEAELLAVPQTLAELLRIPAESRSAAQENKLRAGFLHRHAPSPLQQAWADLAAAVETRRAFVESLPTVMVMQEMPAPRATHLLVRGQYDRPGEQVMPGVPAVFPPLVSHAPPNRLGLAHWLVSPKHPLTARVAVNRFWQLRFGTGLVKTAEDFGAQGSAPSHPELLDWLACELAETGWNIKALQRLMVTSAAYRQSSNTTPELQRLDPDNRWLARAPRYRLPAETIRDQALFATGLLHEELGGPSVKPYQPAGLWQEIATDTEYDQSHGPGLYRRSLYTYWKRTVAPPTMLTLDATARETCLVQRTRTNTPLQALALMNDVTYVEAARVLAQQLLEQPAAPEERISQAFVRLTARLPSQAELTVLRAALDRSLAEFKAEPAAAQKLIESGEYPVADSGRPTELAAYTALVSLIMNLDEVLNRE